MCIRDSGHGTGDLLDACIEKIDWENRTEYPEEYTKVAVIGKPNVCLLYTSRCV